MVWLGFKSTKYTFGKYTILSIQKLFYHTLTESNKLVLQNVPKFDSNSHVQLAFFIWSTHNLVNKGLTTIWTWIAKTYLCVFMIESLTNVCDRLIILSLTSPVSFVCVWVSANTISQRLFYPCNAHNLLVLLLLSARLFRTQWIGQGSNTYAMLSVHMTRKYVKRNVDNFCGAYPHMVFNIINVINALVL